MFLDSKITKLKKSKFWYFSKGAGGWAIGKKFENFSMFLFYLFFILFFLFFINHQNVFDVILETQKAFLDYKKKES